MIANKSLFQAPALVATASAEPKKRAASDLAHQNTAHHDDIISPRSDMISHMGKTVKGESYHPSVGAICRHLSYIDMKGRCQEC